MEEAFSYTFKRKSKNNYIGLTDNLMVVGLIIVGITSGIGKEWLKEC